MRSMILGVRIKAPDARRDADISFEQWLPEGDVITDAEAEADSDDLNIESVQLFDDVVKVWISGGIDGESYTVTVTATTQGGRIQPVCFKVRVTGC